VSIELIKLTFNLFKKVLILLKFIRIMFYFIFSVFGGLLGFQIAKNLQETYGELRTSPWNLWSFVIVGILIGIVITPPMSNLFMRLMDKVILAIKKVSLQETILGSIGLIFGLLIATFINLALGFIPFERIEILGELIKPFIYLIMVIFWGYLGVFFATRMIFVQNFGNLFSNPAGAKTPFVWDKNLKILDTSVIVDGRIYEICKSGFIEGTLLVPRFVLNEIQQIADSSDNLKRNRGRRGLDVLHNLRNNPGIQISDKNYEDVGVDAKLIKLAQELNSPILTTDYNLNKVAQLQGLKVLNINELANAVKPVVLPGELMEVTIIKEGKESGQGVGYLDDGTMIVIEDGKRYIGDKVSVEVTSVIQTMAGKMIFGKRRLGEPKNSPQKKK